MALCQSCGDCVPEGALNCPACGQEIDWSIPCDRCGFPMKPGMDRCVSCGRYLGEPCKFIAPQYRLQPGTVEVRPAGAVLRPPDTDSSWYAPARNRRRVLAMVTKPRRRTDPLFIAALLCAIGSLVFTWMPRLDVSLAGTGLILSLVGYQRYFSYKHRGRYAGLWINYLATVIGTCGLVAGIGLTALV